MIDESQRLSHDLRDWLQEVTGQSGLCIADWLKPWRHRGIPACICAFAVIGLLPIGGVPGFSLLIGLPLALLSLQLMLNHEQVWLPARLKRRRFGGARLTRLMARTLPALERVESMLSPRLRALSATPLRQAIGLLIFLLSLLLMLPIPLTNLPICLAILLLALGLTFHDGVVIVIGLAVIGAMALAVSWLLLSF